MEGVHGNTNLLSCLVESSGPTCRPGRGGPQPVAKLTTCFYTAHKLRIAFTFLSG